MSENNSDQATHGGMAWDYDSEGRPYWKSVAACEAEDIAQARRRLDSRRTAFTRGEQS